MYSNNEGVELLTYQDLNEEQMNTLRGNAQLVIDYMTPEQIKELFKIGCGKLVTNTVIVYYFNESFEYPPIEYVLVSGFASELNVDPKEQRVADLLHNQILTLLLDEHVEVYELEGIPFRVDNDKMLVDGTYTVNVTNKNGGKIPLALTVEWKW